MLPIRKVGKRQWSSAKVPIEPDTEVVQSYSGSQPSLETFQQMSSVLLETQGVNGEIMSR